MKFYGDNFPDEFVGYRPCTWRRSRMVHLAPDHTFRDSGELVPVCKGLPDAKDYSKKRQRGGRNGYELNEPVFWPYVQYLMCCYCIAEARRLKRVEEREKEEGRSSSGS